MVDVAAGDIRCDGHTMHASATSRANADSFQPNAL